MSQDENFNIFVISAGGGAGKTRLVDELLKRDGGKTLHRSTSWTSRAQRPGEPDDAYVFVSRREFEKRVEDDLLLPDEDRFLVEFVRFAPDKSKPEEYDFYGTPQPDPPAGKDIIMVIELEGAARVKRRRPKETALIYIDVPADVRAERMRRRGDPEEKIAVRLMKGEEEDRIGREIADYTVPNDDLDSAVAALEAIIASHRASNKE